MELMRLLQAWLLAILFSFVDTAEQSVYLGPMEVLSSIKDLLFPPRTNAFQGERDRREANGQNDMEFSLPIGLKMGLKFNNPSDVKEGGVAYLNIDNSRKFMPVHKLENLNLEIQFSGFERRKFDMKALLSMTNSRKRKVEATVEMNQKCKDSQCTTRIMMKNVAEVNIVTDFDMNTPPFNTILTRTQIEVNLVDKNMKMGYGDGDGEGEIYFAFEDKPETRIRFHTNRFEGVLQGKTISGHKSVKNGKHQVEIKYIGRALLQLELERKSSIVRAKYSISGGSVASGKFRYKKDEKDQLRIQLKEDKFWFKPRLDITFKRREGGFTIESRKGGLLLWKDTIAYNVTRGGIDIETHLEISPNSTLYKLKEKEMGKWGKYLFDKERKNRFSIWLEKSNAQSLLPQIKSSFKFENDVGGLFNIKLDSISKVFSLDVDFVDHSLQLLCDQTFNGKHGQTIMNQISYDGEEYLKFDISTEKEMDGNLFSILSRFDYLPQREETGIDFKLVSQSENQTRIEVKAQKMRQELCNYVLDTKLLNTQTDSEISFNDTLNFRESNLLEKYLPTHALNPSMTDFVRFNQQKSVLNMKINKEQKHAKVKGSIEQDGQQSLDFLINTEKQPFVFRIKTPRRKGSLESMGITVTHKLGQYIELKSDYPYFKGFRINRIGRNKHEILWNGENMGMMDVKGTIADEVKSTLRSIEHAMAHIFENISKTEDIPRILKDGMMILLVWIDLTWEQYACLLHDYMKLTRTTEVFDLIIPLIPVGIMTNNEQL